MPRKNEDGTIVTPESDSIIRSAEFFKPAWEVTGAAKEESQRLTTSENERADGEG